MSVQRRERARFFFFRERRDPRLFPRSRGRREKKRETKKKKSGRRGSFFFPPFFLSFPFLPPPLFLLLSLSPRRQTTHSWLSKTTTQRRAAEPGCGALEPSEKGPFFCFLLRWFPNLELSLPAGAREKKGSLPFFRFELRSCPLCARARSLSLTRSKRR